MTMNLNTIARSQRHSAIQTLSYRKARGEAVGRTGRLPAFVRSAAATDLDGGMNAQAMPLAG